MYGTTRAFLDYFNLRSLDDLPPLAEIQALIEPQLAAEGAAEEPTEATEKDAAGDAEHDEPQPLAEVVQLPLAER